MTAYFDIESAMQTKLRSVNGSVDIEFEGGKPYSPIIGTKFWRTQHLPVSTEQVTADGLREHRGVYKVDVIIPNNGRGLKNILNDMDSIATAFDTANYVENANVKIQISGVTRGTLQREDSWLYSFVKILYIAYTN